MMRGRPAVYATFSSYDEVAHHSGLDAPTPSRRSASSTSSSGGSSGRAALRRALQVVVLSDHGQTQGTTFKQRNGYGLERLVERSLGRGTVSGMGAGDEHEAAVSQAMNEATGRASAGSTISSPTTA